MPIEGRTVDECVAQFRNVISKLFQRVLHKTKVVRAHQLGHRFLIGYIDDAGEVQPVRLARGQGAAPLFVRLWQEVEVYEPGSEAVTKGKRKGSSDRRLPTGYLPVEEVLRFLIVDLGHRAPCGDDWDKVLEESKKEFFEELSSKPARYAPEGRTVPPR